MSNNNANAPSEKNEEKLTVAKQKERLHLLMAAQDFSGTTSKIVSQAANILETEIAAGIQAFKKTEKQVLNSEKFRYEKPDEVMQRFRRDAHEVVDIFIDIVGVSLKNMEKVTNTMVIKSPLKTGKPEKAPVVKQPTITVPNALKAGETSEIPISLENSSDVQTDEFNLYSTDLISDSGDRISADALKFMPPTVKIEPHKSEKIMVMVTVPSDAHPGVYCGLVLAANMNQLRSEIVINVEE
ncbi:MAG: hypothetical protein NWF01_11870 [Candidatus Bathyarchaeota archaeon]|nr:hypothetical protein [Candidatus Bathyarchaeota archaeon]